MNSYAQSVLEDVSKRCYWEKEFIQAVTEVFESISLTLDREPKYKKARILERIIEPERIVCFRVPWIDDKGEVRINRGYRVQFNSALGPYKGGLRFHSTVTLSIIKFLGFEQIFKNSLTGLPMGGGKGGSDFDLKGKTDREVMNFCQSFMTELNRHIGANTDVPAGDIGVGAREIGYLFGQYKRLKNVFEGVLTGKSLNWGGSLIRPQATGFGVTYFAQEMLKTKQTDFSGKTVCISGFGNVAWGAVTKVTELGGKVVTLSGPDGFVYDKDGIQGEEKLEYMLVMRASGRDRVQDYADQFGVEFYPNKRPWGVKCDIALPCATQNELDKEDAEELVKNGCICVAEGANMPVTLDAMKVIRDAGILYAPGKASNAGGVGVLAKAFIIKAGTIILICNAIVQILQTFNWQFQVVGQTAPDTSILASLATPLAWIFIPLGFGIWQFAAAAITGFIAKENVVGTLAVTFAVTNFIDIEELALVTGGADVMTVFGIGAVAGLSYLVFNLFTPPCFAAIGSMNAEMESPKWLWGAIAFQLGMGYVLSFLVYQLGTLFTTGTVGAGFFGGLIASFVMVGYVVFLMRKGSARSIRSAAEEVA